MALFTMGEQAKEIIQKKKVDLKKAYIKLKDGQSVRVRIPGIINYVTYTGHDAFKLGIYLQPCTLSQGRCAYDEVMDIVRKLPDDHELKKFDVLYPKDRAVFAFADLTAGEIRFLDVSKKQAEKLVAEIEKYKKHLNTYAFDLTRRGEKQDTTYSLNPVLEEMSGPAQQAFDSFNGVELTEELFESVIAPRAKTFKQQVQLLKNAGFPVEQYFDVELDEDDDVKNVEDEPEKRPEDVF